MIEYNATVLKRYADGLYSRSYALIVVFTMLGAAIGFVVAFGLWNFTNLVRLGYLTEGGKWAIVVVLTVLGLAIGAARGFKLRLKAQEILCQVAIEENTRSLLQSFPPVKRNDHP